MKDNDLFRDLEFAKTSANPPSEEEVEKFINTLPSVYQQLYRVRYVENMQTQEIAAAQSCSASTVYRKHASLLFRLKKEFNPALFEKAKQIQQQMLNGL